MKFIVPLAAVLSLVFADPGFVQLPVSTERINKTAVHGTGLNKRAYDDTLQNGVTQYFVDIALGTPGQSQHVSIDTGSSDLWVYAPGSQNAPSVYDPTKSSTSKFISNDFSITYVDQSSAKGNYYTDESQLGNVKVNFQFGTAQEEATDYGVFGIATSNNEADGFDGPYPNYPVALKQNGLIESTAYSLYLNDVNAASGSLLFGGVDTSKYSGQLYTVPITSQYSFNVDFEVGGQRLNGVLDSGTSFTFLPDDYVSQLAQQYGATWDDSQGLYFVDQATTDTSLTFNFSGVKITVPSSELFINYNGRIAFTIGPQSSAANNIILGDSFLRSAYVVYDLDNNQIAIAPVNYNGSGSIETITQAGIPGTQPAPGF